jgi:hypothetical protein
MLNPFRKLNSLISSAIALPNALHAVVEMAWEANANRLEHESDAVEVRRLRAQVEELKRVLRATEAFESVCPGGPALYHANPKNEELAFKLRELESELSHSKECL